MKNVKYVFAKVEFLLFYFLQIGYNKTAYGSYYRIEFCNTKLLSYFYIRRRLSMDQKYDVITLGEILLRLSTPINGRLAQGDTLMRHLGGAEFNIASEIGQLGLKTCCHLKNSP